MKPYLYISPNGYLGGAEKVVLELCKIHQEFSEPCAVICFKAGALTDELKRLSIPVFILKTTFKLGSPISLLKALKELRKIIVEVNPQIINTTMAYGHLVTGLSTLNLNYKTFWFQHGPVGGTLDLLASFFKNQAIIFNSSFLKKRHQNSPLFQFYQSKFEILPLPIEIPHSTPKVSGTFTIGSVGRITQEKGQDQIIKAFNQANLDSSELLIIGKPNQDKDQAYFDYLKELAQNGPKASSIHFLGHQNNVSSYYQQMDLFIHAGKLDEGFGLAVAEAMANQACVISSTYGGLSDLVQDNQTALRIDPRGPNAVESLTKAISYLFKNKDKRIELATNGLNYISKNYSKSATHQKLLAIYQS